jgi:acyl-coenzyme A thioesterase PaaI-like protein
MWLKCLSVPHVFDQAIAMELQADGLFAGHTSPAYANMVGPFGGISAAQMMNAVLLHPDRLGEPVSLTINFAAALAPGPFVVSARAVRTNRSTQHWIVEVLQGGETVLTRYRVHRIAAGNLERGRGSHAQGPRARPGFQWPGPHADGVGQAL